MKQNPFDVIAKYQNAVEVKTEEVATDLTEGRIIAYLITSEVLGADIWFALDDSFNPGDGIPVFYPDELDFLKNKDTHTLRKIYETKLAWPTSRVRQ